MQSCWLPFVTVSGHEQSHRSVGTAQTNNKLLWVVPITTSRLWPSQYILAIPVLAQNLNLLS